MRNVFLFIRRYHTFLLFLLLQIICWWFLASFNRFHQARFLTVAQDITGSINSRYDRVEDFFQLRAENQRVHRLNDSLMNLMIDNDLLIDTIQSVRQETSTDSIKRMRRYV